MVVQLLCVAKTISFAVKSCQDKIHYVILNNISNLQKDLLFT
uniref:Bm14273 n=1 Tax=Brugia malayi TaxID=6279 RepID=A0A0J9Y0X9_BRUMA|nr:Bm14273 [Brugia malayi]